MMRTLSFARWSLSSDMESTKERYVGLSTGAPEECGCEPCRNFAAQRTGVYPAAVLELFESLGIEANREAETYHMARLKSGKHLYGGWFHFVGSILDGQDAAVQVSESLWRPALEEIADGFSLGFTSKLALVPKSFDGLQAVQLEFNAQLPWTLESKEPE
jgi:hypothetical protein